MASLYSLNATEDIMTSDSGEWANGSLTRKNMTLDEYLTQEMGPKHLPLHVVLPVSAVYAAIFVSGVVGNVSVCAVIVRMPELHTATNYYLFSLAVSDLALLLLGLPNEMSVFWQQYPWPLGEPLCKFRAIVSEMVSYTSVLTIVAFSTERYLAICHPLYAYKMKGLRRALIVIGSIWLVALGAALPFGVYTKVSYIEFPPGSGRRVADSAFCAMLQEDVPEGYPVYELSMLFFFVLPMLALLVLYARMAAALWWPARRGHALRGAVHRRSGTAAGRRSVVKMLAAVVLAFFLCWAPFHLQRVLYLHARDWPVYKDLQEVMFYVTGCLYYFSSTVNPILYNVMSARYRHAFRRTLCCLPPPPGSSRRLAREASSYQESVAYGSVYLSQGRRLPMTTSETSTPRSGGGRLRNGLRASGGDVGFGSINGKRRSSTFSQHSIASATTAVTAVCPAAGETELSGLGPCIAAGNANCATGLLARSEDTSRM